MLKSRNALCAAGLILVATTAAREGRADPPMPVSNEMRAEQLFQLGEKKFDSGRFSEACADFSESLRLGPKLGTLLNLALCHETVGKLATAWSEYGNAAAWAAQNGQRDRHEFAIQHVQAIETRLPRVLFQLPAGSAIAGVEIDGEPLPDARWYLPHFLDAGEHSVAVTSPGKKRQTVAFRVIASPTEQLVIVPPLADDDPAPAKAAPPPSPADPNPGRRLAGFITLGAGAAGLAVGTAFGVMAVSARNDIGTHCAKNYCDAEGATHYRDAQSDATVSTIAFVVGAAATGVGAWLVLSSTKGATATAAVGVRPRAGGADLGLGAVF